MDSIRFDKFAMVVIAGPLESSSTTESRGYDSLPFAVRIIMSLACPPTDAQRQGVVVICDDNEFFHEL